MICRSLIFFALAFPLAACGVKGKPLPPLEPAPIGDGRLKSKKNERRKPPVVTAPREESPSEEPTR